MKEIVKKEALKLLEVRMIYLISNRVWVSLVHMILIKGRITFIKNEKNELTLTYTVIE